MIVRYGPPLFQILRGLHSEYNVALMKAVPDQARMFRDFLFYFLKNSIIVHYVISHSKRSAGLIGVSRETLDNIYERKLAALDDLKESLLHQAFNGNL